MELNVLDVYPELLLLLFPLDNVWQQTSCQLSGHIYTALLYDITITKREFPVQLQLQSIFKSLYTRIWLNSLYKPGEPTTLNIHSMKKKNNWKLFLGLLTLWTEDEIVHHMTVTVFHYYLFIISIIIISALHYWFYIEHGWSFWGWKKMRPMRKCPQSAFFLIASRGQNPWFKRKWQI